MTSDGDRRSRRHGDTCREGGGEHAPSPGVPPGLLDEDVDAGTGGLEGNGLTRPYVNGHVASSFALGASITSTMIAVNVNKADPTDLYEQVAGELRRAIADGEAKPGDRLPPAKDLAAVLGVNTNTVLRALRVLRDEGLLEFRRGRGISVAATPQRGAVVLKARELVEFARRQGYRIDELVEIVRGVA